MVQLSRTMLAPHGLSKAEVGRYSRQLLVGEFGVPGQERLKAGRVLLVGAGGLGCPCATYLAAAGVGTIGIVDFDTVSLDNLHRQVAHKERNVGRRKTESLRDTLLELNSSIRVVCHAVTLDRHCALDIFKQYDVVVDCSDNPATRYLINDACVLLKKPLVSGSALRWEGQLTVYNYGERCPCYRCVFPVPPKPTFITNCAEGGVLGPVVGTIGSMQALEVIKILSHTGTPYAGRLLMFDGLSGRISVVTLRDRSAKCAVCGPHPLVTELIDYERFCGSGVHDKIQEQKVLEPAERVGVAEYAVLRKSRGVCMDIDEVQEQEAAVRRKARLSELSMEGSNGAEMEDASYIPSIDNGRPWEEEGERNGKERMALSDGNGECSSSVSSLSAAPPRVRLFDTRPPAEFAIGRLPEATNIPLEQLRGMDVRELAERLRLPKEGDREKDKDVFFICHRGNDSQLAVRILQDRLSREALPPGTVTSGLRIRDIVGGYKAWADIVDPDFPEY